MNVEPLRRAVLSLAEEDAGHDLAEAEERAAAEVRRSRRDAEALVEHARAEGEAAAEHQAGHTRARARAEARALVLGARREVYDELVLEAQAEARRLRSDPAYPRLLERLARAVRERLGPDAELEVDPAQGGGARGRSGRRSVDYTLPALVETCLGGLGTKIEELWR